MTCHATRPRLRPMHWICTGEDLTILMFTRLNGQELPIVCPTDRLDEALEQPGAELYADHRPAPRQLGDHLHITLGIPE